MKPLPPLTAACLLVMLLLFTQCATEVPRGPQGSFAVKVVPYFGNDVRIYIHTYERINGQRGPALASGRVTGDGVTGFVLPLGKVYTASAYADLDGDGRQGPNDPAAIVEGLRPVADVNASQQPTLLTLPGAGVSADWPQKSGTSTESPTDALVREGLDRARDAAPQLPIPSPPPPVPPPPR